MIKIKKLNKIRSKKFDSNERFAKCIKKAFHYFMDFLLLSTYTCIYDFVKFYNCIVIGEFFLSL